MTSPSPVVPDEDEAFFFAGAAEGELRLRRCAGCGRVRHPPTPMCPVCHSTAPDWAVVSGRGTVHAWILARHPARPDEAPRLVALVDLAEGHRLVTNLVDVEPEAIVPDLPVEVRFVEIGGVVLPCFAPAGDSA